MSKKPLATGMAYLKIAIPKETLALLDAQAHDQGIARQALVAPVMNAFARGEIRQGYTAGPDLRQ